MSERRCPRCGGLVGPEAEWCGQCLTRLDGAEREADGPSEGDTIPGSARPEAGSAPTPEAEPPSPARGETPESAVSSSQARTAPIRVDSGRPVWRCPSCGLENGLDDDACERCSYRFADLFEERPSSTTRISPARAALISALLPGAGHIAAGRAADGVARLVVFAYALGTALLVLLAGEGGRGGPLIPLGGVALAAAVAVYVTASIDASRVAEGRDPIVPNRVLLYGAILLMLLTVIVLVVSGLRVSSAR